MAEEPDSPPLAFEDLVEEDFTPVAWAILDTARLLGEGRPRPDVVSVRRLLASMLLFGLEETRTPHTGTWLVSLLDRDSNTIRRALGQQYPVVQTSQGYLKRLLASKRVRFGAPTDGRRSPQRRRRRTPWMLVDSRYRRE